MNNTRQSSPLVALIITCLSTEPDGRSEIEGRDRSRHRFARLIQGAHQH